VHTDSLTCDAGCHTRAAGPTAVSPMNITADTKMQRIHTRTQPALIFSVEYHTRAEDCVECNLWMHRIHRSYHFLSPETVTRLICGHYSAFPVSPVVHVNKSEVRCGSDCERMPLTMMMTPRVIFSYKTEPHFTSVFHILIIEWALAGSWIQCILVS
jgi:hypothetical protein